MSKKFKYGMKTRPFSIGCQPMDGLVSVVEDKKYYNIITYDRMLTDEEIASFELADLNRPAANKLQKRRREMGLSVQELSRLSGVAKRSIEKYEGIGLNSCSAERAVRIANILNCNVKDLME